MAKQADRFRITGGVVDWTTHRASTGLRVQPAWGRPAGYLLSFVLLVILTSPAYSQTRVVITAEADAYILESLPEASPSEQVRDVISAGIGSSGRAVSYVRFDLTDIPDGNLVNSVLVESGRVSLLTQSLGMATPEARFLVTISYCPESTWSEYTMTWNSRVCDERMEGEDSVIIYGYDLPQIYTWDVTRSVANAKSRGEPKITFVIGAIRLQENPRDIVGGDTEEVAERIGFVRFWSHRRATLGVSAVPTLSVHYSNHPTALTNFLSSTLAVLSAVGVALGIYGVIGARRTRKMRIEAQQ